MTSSKALRLAAYLLIAHFLVLVALSLLSGGSPNYVQVVITVALLIAATRALFSPHKRGWLAVLGYAIVVVSSQAAGLWAQLSNPATSLGVKVTALVFLAVIDALAIAALVLVFKPANFAAFASVASSPGEPQVPAPKV